MYSRVRSSLIVVVLGAFVFSGCAYTSMSEKEMTKESGAMKSGDAMTKEGQMMKDDKGMIKK